MTKMTIESLPGGFAAVSGGTRRAINFDRPWQTQIYIDPASCPFENKPQDEEAHFSLEDGWRVLQNRYTPFPSHRLIIPERCWLENDLRQLGGQTKVATAISIAESLISDSDDEFWLGVHVGPLAGQNI